jgi:arsenate reductase
VPREDGIATEGLFSQSWDDLPEKPDAATTLRADAAGGARPPRFGHVVRSHWGMPEPAEVQGDEVTVNAAFAETLAVLRKRVKAPVKELEAEPNMDPTRLQTVLDTIATISTALPTHLRAKS